jgi:hypothetical protein
VCRGRVSRRIKTIRSPFKDIAIFSSHLIIRERILRSRAQALCSPTSTEPVPCYERCAIWLCCPAIMKHTRALRRVARSHIGSQGPNPDEECVRREPSAHIMDKCGALLLLPTWQSLSTLQLAYEHSYYCNLLLENASWNSCEINSLSPVTFLWSCDNESICGICTHLFRDVWLSRKIAELRQWEKSSQNCLLRGGLV